MNSSMQRGINNHPNSANHSATHSEIIGEFCLETEQYLIVTLTDGNESNGIDGTQTFPANCLADSTLANHLIEIARFEINGQSCAILKGTQDRGTQDQGTQDNRPGNLDLTLLLTGRELQIATLVAQGYGNKQVAKQLHISEWTVSSYLRRIFAKLGVESRAAMVFRCAPIIHRLQTIEQNREAENLE
jgi:DNA-binding NarL/FixJ family response regulator